MSLATGTTGTTDPTVDRLEVTGAIPRLTEATITAIAEHLHAGEGAVAATVRDLLDEEVLAQGEPSQAGDATYRTVGADQG